MPNRQPLLNNNTNFEIGVIHAITPSSSPSRWENTYTFKFRFEGKEHRAIVDPGSSHTLVNMKFFSPNSTVKYSSRPIRFNSQWFKGTVDSYRSANFNVTVASQKGYPYKMNVTAALIDQGYDIVFGQDFISKNQLNLGKTEQSLTVKGFRIKKDRIASNPTIIVIPVEHTIPPNTLPDTDSVCINDTSTPSTTLDNSDKHKSEDNLDIQIDKIDNEDDDDEDIQVDNTKDNENNIKNNNNHKDETKNIKFEDDIDVLEFEKSSTIHDNDDDDFTDSDSENSFDIGFNKDKRIVSKKDQIILKPPTKDVKLIIPEEEVVMPTKSTPKSILKRFPGDLFPELPVDERIDVQSLLLAESSTNTRYNRDLNINFLNDDLSSSTQSQISTSDIISASTINNPPSSQKFKNNNNIKNTNTINENNTNKNNDNNNNSLLQQLSSSDSDIIVNLPLSNSPIQLPSSGSDFSVNISQPSSVVDPVQSQSSSSDGEQCTNYNNISDTNININANGEQEDRSSDSLANSSVTGETSSERDMGDPVVMDQCQNSVSDRLSIAGFDEDDVAYNLDDTISEESCQQLRQEIKDRYAKLFVKELPHGAFKDRGIYNMKIELLPGTKPTVIEYGRLSREEREQRRETLKSLLKAGVVEQSFSSWSSPGFYVRVPGKDPRFVIDFTAVNKNTVDFALPMARIDEILESVGGNSIITVIDLKAGFHHLMLDPDSRKYTAFRIDGKLYQWVVPCFGLKNAPAYFNFWLQSVLGDYHDFCKLYVDDIIIFSKSIEEHRDHLHKVFSKLEEEEIYLSDSKAQLVMKEVEYAGHRISKDGIRPIHSKVDAILNLPYPTTVKEVRQFLGAVNWYRNCVPDLNSLTAELTDLTKLKKKQIQLTDSAKASIDKIKEILTSDICLALADYKLPFNLYVDASDVGTGLMITQIFDGVERPILYDSKKFDTAQRNYNTKDRELLAIVNALVKYGYMLKDKTFNLFTDHKNLLYLENSRDLSKRSERWHEFISPFSFDIKHIKGEDNAIPDMLSRDRSFYVGWDSSLTNEIIESYNTTVAKDKKFLDAISKRKDVEIVDGLIFIDGHSVGSKRLVLVDPEHIYKILYEAHSTPYAGHPGRDRLHDKVSQHYYFPKFTRTVEKFVRTCVECQKSRLDTKKHGWLNSLPIPPRPWIHLSIDYMALPMASDGCDNLFVVVDRFSKMVRLFACKSTVTAKETARWFCDNIVCKFGIPDSIVSDRDPKFTGDLWKHTMEALGTTLNMTQPHRPQADGQTERVNRVIKEIITKMAANRRRWSQDIALIELAINHNISTSTGLSPFTIVHGFEPKLPWNSHVSRLGDYGKNIQYYKNIVKDNLLDAQIEQAHYHNRDVSPTSYNVGDEVLVKRNRFNSADKSIFKNDRKLFALFCGPFKIIEKRSDVNYVIDPMLVNNRSRVVHVDDIKLFLRNEDEEALDSLDPYDSETVEAIIGRRAKYGGSRLEYKVRLSGLTEDNDIWLPKHLLSDYKDLIKKYDEMLDGSKK